MSAQRELFGDDPTPPAGGWSIFKGKGGATVRYLTEGDRIVRIDLGTGQSIPVTRQSRDRNYVVVPGYGQVQESAVERGKRFLRTLALVRLIIEARAEANASLARERAATDELINLKCAEREEPGESRGPGATKPPPRKKLSSKLCREPVPIDWEAKRFVPAEAEFPFPKVPLPLLKHQEKFAAGEWRVLCAALEMGTFSGLVSGRKSWSEKAHVDEKDLKIFRRSLVYRGFLRETAEEMYGSPVFELLQHPWYGPIGERAVEGVEGGELFRIEGGTPGKPRPKVPPKQTSQNQTAKADESAAPRKSQKGTRAQLRESDSEKRARGGFAVSRYEYDDDLWRKLYDTAGDQEMHDNGTRWAGRFAFCRDTINTILRDFDQAKEPIRDAGNWLGSAWNASPAGRRRRSA